MVIFEDNFDSYTAGGQLACQNPTDWTTWNFIPCDATQDAYVSDLYAFSGTNSAVFIQNNDVVKPLGTQTSGKWDISFMVYVPAGKTGYFNCISQFFATPQWWALDAYFNTGGSCQLNAGEDSAATFTYAYDTWQSVEVIVDLDNDIGEFWFDGIMIHTWQWTLGSVGQGVPLQLDVVSFWGATANDEMYIDDFVFTDLSPVSVENEEIPIDYALHQNYPNPFNPSTTISYSVSELSFVTLKVYDVLGSEIITLVNEEKLVGSYEVEFYAKGLPSGIYFYRLQVYPANGGANEFAQVKKMILLK
jgi:hypothetical protein